MAHGINLARMAQAVDAQRRQHGLADVPPADIAKLVNMTPRAGDAARAQEVPSRIAVDIGPTWPNLQDIVLVFPKTASWNARVQHATRQMLHTSSHETSK